MVVGDKVVCLLALLVCKKALHDFDPEGATIKHGNERKKDRRKLHFVRDKMLDLN